jgi:hypothetical protein
MRGFVAVMLRVWAFKKVRCGALLIFLVVFFFLYIVVVVMLLVFLG